MADFLVPGLHNRAHVSDAKSRLSAPLNAERQVSVICIGAGASGLLQAYKVQKHFSNMSITVFEKNSDISGTWYENKYPG
jgi:cation diffusion facilitator CzcD-associated flavoprotein CzcO